MMARKVDDGTSVLEVEAKITVKVVDRHLLIKPLAAKVDQKSSTDAQANAIDRYRYSRSANAQDCRQLRY